MHCPQGSPVKHCMSCMLQKQILLIFDDHDIADIIGPKKGKKREMAK